MQLTGRTLIMKNGVGSWGECEVLTGRKPDQVSTTGPLPTYNHWIHGMGGGVLQSGDWLYQGEEPVCLEEGGHLKPSSSPGH